MSLNWCVSVIFSPKLDSDWQGLKVETPDEASKDLVELALNKVEEDKLRLALDLSKDAKHCEKFALRVFSEAKKRDEQGISNLDTAKSYYAVYLFIEVGVQSILTCTLLVFNKGPKTFWCAVF